jgi:predicted enzyme related to lactoylglutathione lyase
MLPHRVDEYHIKAGSLQRRSDSMSNTLHETSVDAITTGISGPGFVSLQVRDLAAAADFYEHTVGLTRDPQPFPRAVAFLTSPIPFALLEVFPNVNLDNLPMPGLGTAVWFKAADGQAAHDALSQAGVTIIRAPYDGPFGRTFTFADLDGYAITVYERDTPIIERLPPAQ